MLEKRGQRSIFKTGFYMKTHKPKSATFLKNLKKVLISVSPYMRPIPYMRPVPPKPTYGSNSNNNSQ